MHLALGLLSCMNIIKYKEAFFLRHTACLPSNTSQLVLFHHLFCIHFLGGGPLLCSLLRGSTFGGVHFCVHFWGSTSVFTSGGGSTSMFPSGGVHFHVHFWGGPHPYSLLGVTCDLSHNALIYHYRMP